MLVSSLNHLKSQFEFITGILVFRHMVFNDPIESFGMIGDDEMGHLMDHDVFETVKRIMDEIGTDDDPVLPGVADAPLGSHLPGFQFRLLIIAVFA